MSVFFTYSVTEVISTLTRWFNLDLSTLTNFESICLTILVNIYFFIFWGFIIYCILKSLNWVYERLF